MTSFDRNKNLGGAVSSWTTFSEIGNKPITDKKQLTIAGGRHKMSRLCGFIFTAKDGKEQFAMTYICKLRSKINHQQKKQVRNQWTIPSRWFFLTRTGSNQLNVISKQKAMSEFNFNVDAFFDSDLFKNEVPKLQKTVKSGLPQARKFAEALNQDEERKLAIEEINAIKLSIPLMLDHRFEDKNYPLINYEIKETEDMTNEASFDHYDWKDGSLTGKGLFKMIEDSSTEKQNVLNAPVRIYDRTSNKYYNIVDSHLGKKNTSLMLEIDTSKPYQIQEDVEQQIDEADDRELTSHALDIVGVKASTATTAGQDVAEISMIDAAIDEEIEEAMKEIYK